MNASKHNQKTNCTAVLLAIFSTFIVAKLSADERQEAVVTATPVAQVIPKPVAPTAPYKRDKGLAKFFGKTMKTVSHKKKRNLPLYNEKGELKNDIASRLLDPQRKESPIRTARLFKIQISEGKQAVVEEKVISSRAAAE